MKERRTKPTARELEKVGAASLAAKYGVSVSQIRFWKHEARERSGVMPKVARTEQLGEVLGDMKRRGLTADDLAPDFPDRDLLERFLAEDPGPARDRPEEFLFDDGPLLEQARSSGQPLIRPRGSDRVNPVPPSQDDDRERRRWERTNDVDTSLPLLWAASLAVLLITLIALGVWK